MSKRGDNSTESRHEEVIEIPTEFGFEYMLRPSIRYGTREEAEEVLMNLHSEYTTRIRRPPVALVYGPAWCGPLLRQVRSDPARPSRGFINYIGRTDAPVYQGDGGLGVRIPVWRVDS